MSCQIICEVIAVDGPDYCSGAAKMKVGNTFLAGLKTPEPVGMCAKAYVALYPVIVTMQDPQKGMESHEADCPDGKVRYRLTRHI